MRQGDVITPDFDPLLAKLIVHAPTRAGALARARQALRDFVVLGLHTNAPYLLRVLSHADIEAGAMHTGWLAQQHESLTAPASEATLAAASAVAARHRQLPIDQQRDWRGGFDRHVITRDAVAHARGLAWLSGRWNGVRTAHGWLPTAREPGAWRTP